MKGRRIVTGVVAAVAAAGLVGVAGPDAQAAPNAHAAAAAPGALSPGVSNPAGTVKALLSVAGFQALVDSVKAQVHAQYPDATFRDVVGDAPSGPTTSITDVTRWQFNFNDVIGDSDHILVRATVFLPSWTATLTILHSTAVYSQELTEPVAMSPFEATVLLRIAGYREPFRTVIYAQPVGRSYPHPLYIVDQGDERVAVDTVTRHVAPFHYMVGPST